MGLFNSKRRVYVSSSAINMAGDFLDRPNYLKTTVLGGVLNSNGNSIGNVINGAYLKGPKIKFDLLNNWANKDSVGGYAKELKIKTSQVFSKVDVDASVILAQLPSAGANQEIKISKVLVDFGLFDYWADQHMLLNYPNLINTEWETRYEQTTNKIWITFVDGSNVSFDANFDSTSRYLFVLYSTGTTVTTTVPPPLNSPPGTLATTTTKFVYSVPTLFIYKKNSGNSILDNVIGNSTKADTFIPFIPIRLDNKFVSKQDYLDIFKQTKKAYFRSIGGGRIKSLIEKINEIEELPEIDYVHMMFGVSLNSKNNADKEYIYSFFKEMSEQYSGVNSLYVDWKTEFEAAKNSFLTYQTWTQAQNDSSNALYGTPQPAVIPYPQLTESTIKLYSERPELAFDYGISWTSIEEKNFTGKYKPDAKRNQLWLIKEEPESFTELNFGVIGSGDSESFGLIETTPKLVNTISIYFQQNSNAYKKLTITNLINKNVIYEGNYVTTTSHEALDDPEESKFIIPIHSGVLKNMRMVQGTQTCTASTFLLFNTYQVVKIKWYQRGFFKILIIIAAIVYAAYTGDVGTASGIISSTNAVVVSLSVATGISAAIIAAGLSAIATMVIMSVVEKVAPKIFGEKLGAIITVIAALYMASPESFSSTQTVSSVFSDLMQAKNIIKLTDAVSQGYTAYVGASLERASQEFNAFMSQNKSDQKAVNDEIYKNFNSSADITFALSGGNFAVESPNTFLSRTLMTGGDIAEMSLRMVSEFSNITVNTNLPS